MPDSPITEKPVTGPVRVELHAGWPGGSTTETVEVDRAEWNTLTHAQRREMLEDDAQALLGDYVSCGYAILGDDEGSDEDTEDQAAALPVVLADRDTETAAQGEAYIVDFEPGLYGPFPTVEAAHDWAAVHVQAALGGTATWSVRPLWPSVAAASPRGEQ